MHDDSCTACGGKGVKPKRRDRHKYRYFVVINHETWPLHEHDIEDAHGPLPNKNYIPSGLKYRVARNPVGRYGENVTGGADDWTECLTSCGRFTKRWSHGRTFASDREADRTVERLASGLPVFITRAIALAAAIGVVVPAWISAVAALVHSCSG